MVQSFAVRYEFKPKELLIFDILENNVYKLEFDLKKLFPDLKLHSLIESIRDREDLNTYLINTDLMWYFTLQHINMFL